MQYIILFCGGDNGGASKKWDLAREKKKNLVGPYILMVWKRPIYGGIHR